LAEIVFSPESRRERGSGDAFAAALREAVYTAFTRTCNVVGAAARSAVTHSGDEV
jgi:hypothetical protein